MGKRKYILREIKSEKYDINRIIWLVDYTDKTNLLLSTVFIFPIDFVLKKNYARAFQLTQRKESYNTLTT